MATRPQARDYKAVLILRGKKAWEAWKAWKAFGIAYIREANSRRISCSSIIGLDVLNSVDLTKTQ